MDSIVNNARRAANEAFEDTRHRDSTAAAMFQEVVTSGGQLAEALAAFQTLQ